MRVIELDDTVDNDHLKFVKAAVQCMLTISPNLGGTRDVNAMIEHLSFELLLDLGHATLASPIPDAPTSFKGKLVAAITDILDRDSAPSDSALGQVLHTAASFLDSDLDKLRSVCEETDTNKLCSTIHITLPHNKRGSSKGKTWQRNLVNAIAEILIWQKTLVAETDDRFSGALNELKRRPPSIADGHDCILRMQTTARKRRKLLNDRAREEGFMLSSLYLMDKSSVTLRMIRRAKAGDLAMLSKIARKNKDQHILKMILKRNLDPSKATPIESVDALVNEWIDIRTKVDEEKDPIEALELELQENTVRATVQKLSSTTEGTNRPVLVTLVGQNKSNAVGAILVAAAFGKAARLVFGSDEIDVSTHEATMEVINEILCSGPIGNFRDIQQVLESHGNEDSQDIIVFSSQDLELDETVLKSLQSKDIRIRVHSTRKVEMPEGGSIDVQLNDKIYAALKAGAPISLSVLLDCTGSMGREIEGCKEGALALISSFDDLSTVSHANFMGYWDPIGSPGDPEPRSTGFLEPTKSNLDKIQAFVNNELRCMGGGDEPEDVPAALEKLIKDITDAGLSANDGVHFCFFIADAGYRRNEEARVTTCLEELKKMGIVMVMCPVRSYGTSCKTLVARNSKVFKETGQYIELGGVGQLASIASIVTETIRASLFGSSNLVSVTASVGQTLEAIGQVCRFQRDAKELKKVETLTASKPEEMSTKPSTDVFVGRKEFKLSSRDRLFLQLSRLPTICHETVDGAFGGKSLAEQVAAVIAKQLLENEIPVTELDKANYPPDVVESVRQVLGGHGRMHSTDA